MSNNQTIANMSHSSGLESWSKDLNFRKLADSYGTPTYIFNEAMLKKNVGDYVRLIDDVSHILYPVKTNPSIAVLSRLAQWGCGMDCASRDEVDMALFAGVPEERISYNTPAPEFGLIRNLLRSGATVVVDSTDLLKRINNKVPSSHIKGKLVLRLNIDAGSSYLQNFQWESLVHHGSSTSKFGIPAEIIIELLKEIALPITGLHIHVGTMMDNLSSFENMLKLMHMLVDDIHAQTNHRINLINLGGGLGISFLPSQKFPDIETLADQLTPLKRKGISYYVEPGQSLVGNTMGLLMKVVALKEMRNRKWAIVDVGSDQLMKITTVSWHHQILDERNHPLKIEGPDAVGGPLCFAGDTLLPATNLQHVKEGEVLFLQHAGAYLEAIANRFNGRRSVSLVILNEQGHHRLTTPEDPFFSPPLQTYNWSTLSSLWPLSKPLSTDQINALHSKYFNEDVYNDQYKIISFTQTGNLTFAFEVDTQASVNFISVPFAMRIAADAIIIAALKVNGKVIKDVSVWGNKGSFLYKEPIQPGGCIKGSVALSNTAPVVGAKRMIATASMDDYKFTMTSEIVL